MRETIGQEPQNRIRKYIRRTADTAAGVPINGRPLSGARLRCFRVVLTAGQSSERPRRNSDNS